MLSDVNCVSSREMIRENPKVSQVEMSKASGVSRTYIANWLKSAGNTIRRVGGDNGGRWEFEN